MRPTTGAADTQSSKRREHPSQSDPFSRVWASLIFDRQLPTGGRKFLRLLLAYSIKFFLPSQPPTDMSTDTSIELRMKTSTPSLFRIVRPAEEPLGAFFRPGRDGHTVIERLLTEEQIGFLGCVFDACYCATQSELIAELVERRLDAILDTNLIELATPVGHQTIRNRLPWADPFPSQPEHFSNSKCELIADQIAEFIREHGFSAVLAPSHFLQEGAKDAWVALDKRLTFSLRNRLDVKGLRAVRIYYPLAIASRDLLTPASRATIKAFLNSLPVEAIWLRIHPFGSHSSDAVLQRYISLCQHLHGLRLPLIAEKTGVLGLALLAFGAVTGIETGVSSGERFDIARLNRLSSVREPEEPYRTAARVYLPDLGISLSRKEAAEFFSVRALRRFACRNQDCCRDGSDTMIRESRRHFVNARMTEVAELSRITPTLRASEYLERILRPVTDNMSRVLAQEGLSPELRRKFETHRRKQDRWRHTLGRLSTIPRASFSAPFERHNVRNQQTA